MIATASLHIEAPAELDEAIAAGVLQVRVTTVTAAVPGQLLTSDLRPLLIEALTPVAAGEPRCEGTGPLVRVHIATDAS